MDSNNTQSSNLAVLLAEDDDGARSQLEATLLKRFKTVNAARDGKEAFELYKQNSYDVVITDIRMPNVDGLELTRLIKNKNKEQYVVIISAHNDGDILIQLLNAGADRFLPKPVDPKNLLRVLNDISKIIFNKKILEEYQKRIEKTNLELSKKNNELSKTLRVLEAKMKQKVCKKPKPMPKSQIEEKKTIDFNEYVLDDHIIELKELEEEIDYISNVMFLKNKLSDEELAKLSTHLKRYGTILCSYPIFDNLGSSILELSEELTSLKIDLIDNIDTVFEYLESFIFTLVKWRDEAFTNKMEDPNAFDRSMMCDVDTIKAALHGELDDIGNDVEFF